MSFYFVIIAGIVAIIAAVIARREGKSLALLGYVLWPGDALLPQHLRYRVSLVDLTVKGAPLVVASTTERLADRGAGMPFTLAYPEKLVKPQHIYGVWAELIDGDKVIYNSGLATLIDGPPKTAMRLQVYKLVDPSIKAPPSVHNVLPHYLADTQWRILAAGGVGSLPDGGDTLHISVRGQLSGAVADRSYVAEAAFENDCVQVVHLTVSGMADHAEGQARQQRVWDSFLVARQYRLDGTRLILAGPDGAEVLTLVPVHTVQNGTLH
jgi:uncharacterized lipoprotein YbaY